MKLSLNVLQKFMLLFCIGMFIVGCSKNAPEKVNEQQNQTEPHNVAARGNLKITASDLEFVGIEHNAYLEIVYNGLLKKDVSGNEGLDFIKGLLRDELENSRYTNECKALGIQFMEESLTAPLSNPYIEAGNFYPDTKIADYLSAEEKQVLDDLYLIVINNVNSLEVRKRQISTLEDEISLANFTDKQLITLYSATNVAKYSLTYWKANFHKWDMLDGTAGAAKVSFWGATAAGDIGGGVGAAAGVWIVNVVPGAGQVAYGGAILGGAVGGSVTAAITYGLLSWWE